MSELAAIFVTAFLVGLSGALMPGPLLVVNLHQTGRRGWSAAPLVTLGHGVAELLFVLALLFGLGSWLATPSITQLIAGLGGVVLIMMSYSMVKEAKVASLSTLSTNSSSGLGPVSAGLLTSFSNPYWFIWWSTVGAAYVTLARPLGLLGVLAFFSGHLLSDLSWFALVSFTFVSGRRLISDRLYRHLLTALAGFLALLGGGFLYYALRLISSSNI